MRWRGRRRSENVEDRRGQPPAGVGGAGVPLVPLVLMFLRGRRGIWPLLVVAALLLVSGANLGDLLGGLLGQGSPRGATGVSSSGTDRPSPQEEELADFTRVVLADLEDTWDELFHTMGRRYEKPVLVMYTGTTRSACGLGRAAMGPFYCPADRKVYIDLGFYRDLRRRFKAPGDFAQAYVIAHEVGHHVQSLLGISQRVQRAKRQGEAAGAEGLSVRLELQADCLAGVWAHHAKRSRQLLEAGDTEEGLNAASAIGDDRLQRQSRGRVSPDSFTHGSSAQRVRWFRRGIEGGRVEDCDTFTAPLL